MKLNIISYSVTLAVFSPMSLLADEESSSLLGDLFTGIQRLDFDHDLLHSNDISVNRSTVLYRQERDSWDLEISFGRTNFDVDYSDPVGATLPSNRDEESWSGGLTLGVDLSESVSTSIGFTTYDGFTDFQSVWISEYYDQFIGIPFPGTYENSSPKGWGLNTGVVWDYAPGTARVSATFGFSHDDIVPAWSAVPNPANFFIPEAQSTDRDLDTYSGSISWEIALNPRLRTQLNVRHIDITAREPRLQVRNQWAWALSDELTLRAHVGFAVEDPDFEAYYGGIALHYDLNSEWSVTLAGRLYHDTGEVVSAGFNTAAPELDSSEISATIGWSNGDTSIRLGVGIYDTAYGNLDPDNQFFADLYEDRDYTLGRLAFTHQF